MLSILIPTYNYVCAHLVCELQKQCEEVQASLGEENFRYEIIVADDASTDDETISKNAVIEYLPNCRYLESERNVGRAAIRNRLIDKAKGTWIMIIDADAEVVREDFVLTYWQAAAKLSDDCVIVGGIVTPEKADEGCELRHRYELAAEQIRTLEARRRNPDAYFSTFNFMASRKVFNALRFDERCTQYGYEDALFGIELQQYGFRIEHIDNPLQHNGINDNASFLSNTETSLQTLHMLGRPMTDKARVTIAAQRLGMWRPCFRLIYKLCRPLLRRHLLSHHPNLKIFAFYKLGYYLSL